MFYVKKPNKRHVQLHTVPTLKVEKYVRTVPTYYAAVRLQFIHLLSTEMKIGKPVTLALRNVRPNCGFLCVFKLFKLGARKDRQTQRQADRQMDGWTGKTRNVLY